MRGLCAVLLLAAAMPVIGQLYPLLFPTPTVIEATPRTAQVMFTVARPVTGWDGCTAVSWAVTGAQAVRFGPGLLDSAEDVPDSGGRIVCPATDTQMHLAVDLAEGVTRRYAADVVVSTRRLAGLYAGLAVGLVMGAVWVLRPDWRLRLPDVNRRWGVPVALMLVTVALYWPARFIVTGGDFEIHIGYAATIESLADINRPNFLLHLILIALAPLMPANGDEALFQAAFVAFGLANTLTVLLAYAFLRAYGVQNRLVAGGLALATLLLTPITLPTLPDANLYRGYVAVTNLFHNPSTVLLKPFAIVLLWSAARFAFAWGNPRWWEAALMALAVVASALLKPNLVMILLPPVGLFVAYEVVRWRRVRWSLALGMVAPALVILAAQYLGFFTDAATDAEGFQSSVIWAPFGVFLHRESRVWMLALKLGLSAALPLALTVGRRSHWPQMRVLWLAWALYVSGVLYAYLLAESGERFTHGNFVWGANIGVLLLYMVSLGAFATWWQAIEAGSEPGTGGFILTGTLLALHLASGVIWHGVNVASGYGFFWW